MEIVDCKNIHELCIKRSHLLHGGDIISGIVVIHVFVSKTLAMISPLGKYNSIWLENPPSTIICLIASDYNIASDCSVVFWDGGNSAGGNCKHRNWDQNKKYNF